MTTMLRRSQRLADRRLDRVELVVSRHLLGEPPAAVVLEHDEVAQEGEEAPLLEHPLDRHLDLGEEHRGQLLAGDGAPRLEPLPPRGEGAEPGLDAVRHREYRVEGEQRGQLGLVGPELLPGAAQRRVLVRRVLQLDDGERQAVDEQHDVGAAREVALDHGELVDREPVVVRGRLEVEHLHLRASDRAALVAVLHRDPVHRHAVERAVAGFQGRSFGAGQLAEGIVQRLGGQIRVQAVEGVSHHRREDRVRVARPQRVRSGRHVGSADHAVAERPEPVERGLLDDRFGEGVHPGGSARRLTVTRIITSSPLDALSTLCPLSDRTRANLARVAPDSTLFLKGNADGSGTDSSSRAGWRLCAPGRKGLHRRQ